MLHPPEHRLQAKASPFENPNVRQWLCEVNIQQRTTRYLRDYVHPKFRLQAQDDLFLIVEDAMHMVSDGRNAREKQIVKLTVSHTLKWGFFLGAAVTFLVFVMVLVVF